MDSNYIWMGEILARVQNDSVTLGRIHNKTFAGFLKFEIVPVGARTPYEVYMKYNMGSDWNFVNCIGPHDSLICLTKIAEERFNCPISDEVYEAVESLRLARKMSYKS